MCVCMGVNECVWVCECWWRCVGWWVGVIECVCWSVCVSVLFVGVCVLRGVCVLVVGVGARVCEMFLSFDTMFLCYISDMFLFS